MYPIGTRVRVTDRHHPHLTNSPYRGAVGTILKHCGVGYAVDFDDPSLSSYGTWTHNSLEAREPEVGDRVRVTHGSYLSELPIEGTLYSTTETKVFEDRVHRFLVEVPEGTWNGSNHLAGRTVVWASHVELLEPSTVSAGGNDVERSIAAVLDATEWDGWGGRKRLTERLLIAARAAAGVETAGETRSVQDLQAEVRDLERALDVERRRADYWKERVRRVKASNLELRHQISQSQGERDEARAEAEAAGDTLTYALQMLDDEQRQRVAGFYDGVKRGVDQ